MHTLRIRRVVVSNLQKIKVSILVGDDYWTYRNLHEVDLEDLK